MFGTILQRTILMELIRVFLMSLVGITGILLIAGIIAEASQHGLGPMQILAVVPLLIPSTLPYTLPATTLFATCVVYGRLANDNEILAIKAAGVNLWRVVVPALMLGFSMTLVTVVLYFDVIPNTHHIMRTMFLGDIEELLYTMLRRDHFIRHPSMNCYMHVKHVQGRRLIDTVFMRKDMRTNEWDVVAYAREAEIHVDLNQNKILIHMRQGNFTSRDGGGGLFVEDKVWPVDLPKEINPKKLRAADMTWGEMQEYAVDLKKEVEKLELEIAAMTAQLALAQPPETAAKHRENLRFIRQQKKNELNNLDVEMHMRPALSLGCLCFVLVGCPVGIWFSRSDYLSAFITCFLPIVFAYYPLMLCGISLAKGGKLPPVATLWTADALLALIALGLFRKLLRN